MTAHQKFEVHKKYEGFVVREFAACVVADVEVNGDVSSAGTQAFGSLFNYISSNQIAMTAPVIEEELATKKWRVSFVMPEGSKISDLPNPIGSPVVLRELPAHRAAALRFSGRTSEKAVLEHELKLLELVKAQGLKVTGKARVARFDPPWKPPFSLSSN
jgi:effector-binding domain-containing protein